MANLSSVARPYALAAFECAREKQNLSDWTAFLESAANVVRDKSAAKLLKDPEFTSEQAFEFFNSVLTAMLDGERKNFLHLLAQNKRLLALPDIAAEFKQYVAALEKMSSVRVITAVEAEEAFKQRLAANLSKRMNHDVTLHCEVNPAIIGGAIIHIGDKVIDGSVRGKLTRLLEFSKGNQYASEAT